MYRIFMNVVFFINGDRIVFSLEIVLLIVVVFIFLNFFWYLIVLVNCFKFGI